MTVMKAPVFDFILAAADAATAIARNCGLNFLVQQLLVSCYKTLYSLGFRLKTITFRVPEERLHALDYLADVQQRDRSFVLNEAVNQYLSVNEYHRQLIEEGIRDDDAGDLIDHETVRDCGRLEAQKEHPLSDASSLGPSCLQAACRGL